jgi:Na+-transporting NADH:ubiquinone oxidoreductase subunit NqrB
MADQFVGDPRYFQITFLFVFLIYGISVLSWEVTFPILSAAFLSCIITQLAFIHFKTHDYHSLKSALISALSLCLMLKTNHWHIMVLAGVLAIASKFIFRFYHPESKEKPGRSKHFFNPTNFGIIVTMMLTGQAWISPGQWGSNGLLVFSIGLLGLVVLLRVKRLDTAFSFLLTFFFLTCIRSVFMLGWSFDSVTHQFTSGTLLLFTFFMITDPVSTPSHKTARIIWSSLIAMLAFYLANYVFLNGAPLWALFFLSPLTFLLDKLFVHQKFSWI